MTSPDPERPKVDYAYVNFNSAQQLTGEVISGAAVEAAPLLAGLAVETRVSRSDFLSQEGVDVFVKAEADQPGGSFKRRPAAVSVAYHAEHGASEVYTATTGNNGEAIAAAARHHEIKATVVMGHSSTEEKRQLVRQNGARLIVHGRDVDEATEYSEELSGREGGRFVHPGAGPLVVVGGGTMGLELVKQVPDMTHLVLPAGNGGMLAGVGNVVKEHLQGVKVVAAQIEGSTAFLDSLKAGVPLRNQPVDPRFEGLGVGNINPLTFALAQRVVDQTVVVGKDSLHQAAYRHYRATGQWLEWAGAASPAAGGQLASELSGQTEAKIVVVASGANPPRALPIYLKYRARDRDWDDDRQVA